MTNPKSHPPAAHGKMRPKAGAPPGLETDGEGRIIPLAERTEDDRRKARAAGETEGGHGSVKDPEQDAAHPASMPQDQQGQGGAARDDDPEGQQGGYPPPGKAKRTT